MIVCPNCNHSNPEGATQCEACYTPLPVTTACPNCGASVQADAAFCGQCGFNLRGTTSQPKVGNMPDITPLPDIPDLVTPDPLIATPPATPAEVPATVVGQVAVETGSTNSPDPVSPPPVAEVSISPPPSATPGSDKTQLQQQNARLLHVQTNTPIELPQNLSVVHLGKPNDQIPPDIDVSGFPNSEVVSRVHADIRIEGDAHYIEDVGSSNGTYINHTPLPSGNRHRLRPGDRIGLGKGDLMTFLFQLS